MCFGTTFLKIYASQIHTSAVLVHHIITFLLGTGLEQSPGDTGSKFMNTKLGHLGIYLVCYETAVHNSDGQSN